MNAGKRTTTKAADTMFLQRFISIYHMFYKYFKETQREGS